MELDHINILKILNKRLCTPITVIADTVLEADEERAKRMISQLVNSNLAEYILIDRVAITAKGKAFIRPPFAKGKSRLID